MHRRGKFTIFLAFIFAFLFFVDSAMAAGFNVVKVDIENPGSGTGKVTSSAKASVDRPFTGWSGAFCAGKENCILRGLSLNSPKIVIANFGAPLCTQFIYSDFGACQLDGKAHRDIIAAGPPGCVGGNPETSWLCTMNGDHAVPPPSDSYIPYTYIPDETHDIPVATKNPNTQEYVYVYYETGCLSGCISYKAPTKEVTETHTYTINIIKLTPLDNNDGVVVTNSPVNVTGTNPIAGAITGVIPQPTFSNYIKNTEKYMTQEQAKALAQYYLDGVLAAKAAKKAAELTVWDTKTITKTVTKTVIDEVKYEADKAQALVDVDNAKEAAEEAYLVSEYAYDIAEEARAAGDPNYAELLRNATNAFEMSVIARKAASAAEENYEKGEFNDVYLAYMETETALDATYNKAVGDDVVSTDETFAKYDEIYAEYLYEESYEDDSGCVQSIKENDSNSSDKNFLVRAWEFVFGSDDAESSAESDAKLSEAVSNEIDAGLDRAEDAELGDAEGAEIDAGLDQAEMDLNLDYDDDFIDQEINPCY